MMKMGVLDSQSPPFVSLSSWKLRETNNINEPISVLDTRRSPSSSTSTVSGGISGETQIPEPGFLSGSGLAPATEVTVADEWEALLSDSGQDQFLLRWISNELIQGDTNPNPNPNEINNPIVAPPSFSLSPTPPSNHHPQQNPYPQILNLVPQFSNCHVNPHETQDEKPQFFNQFPPNLSNPPDPLSLLHHPPLKRPNLAPFQNPGNFISHPQVPIFDNQPSFSEPETLVSPQPPLKRPNLGTFDSDPRFSELYKHPPETLALVPQQVVYDQLYKAAELILSGNLTNAHSILARLNHQLTPGTLPFQRASFYLKEALLQLPLLGPGSGSPNFLSKNPTPIEGLFKMGAYKLFSEVSPLTNFVNFTSNQAILEAIGDSERVHVIDFDIGSGAQWASFMSELPILGRAKGTPCFKVTAFTSPSTHHPFELGLMHENLTQLANDIGINFELEVVNLDAFDPSAYPVHLFKSQEKETFLAVNFPIWAFSNRMAMLPSLIRFVKQLSPKIVVSMEHGCERFDLSFSNHVLHVLQYYEALLQSIDVSNTNVETVSKIEKFIIQPRIENVVLGRLGYPNQMPHWRALFAAAGFSQVNISNFAEIQAECVLKKTQVGGFHVERKQTLLVLSWQRRELVSASAWRC